MRKYFGLLCAAALMLPVGVITATGAGAAAATPTCSKAAGSATFNPALPKLGDSTKVKSKLNSTGTVSGCTGGGVTKGTTSFKQTSTSTGANCTTLATPKASDKPTTGTLTIKWSATKTSTAPGTTIKQSSATVAVIKGKIKTGTFAGKTITGTVSFSLPKDGSCATKGLSKVTYTNKAGTKFTVK